MAKKTSTKKDVLLDSETHPFSFWDTLDRSISNQPARIRPDINLYPSEASAKIKNEYDEDLVVGGCIRKSWFRAMIQRMEATNVKPNLDHVLAAEPFTPKELWKFSLSKYAEIAITDESKRAQVYETNSFRFKWELPFPYEKLKPVISGELDLAVAIPTDKNYKLPIPNNDQTIEDQSTSIKSSNIVGIEIKSISGYKGPRQVFGVRSKKGHWISLPEPKPEHLLQAILYHMYFCILKKEYKYWKLAYINRENGERKEFDIDLVKEKIANGKYLHRVYVDRQPYKYTLYAEHILQRYQELHKHLENETLPERDFDLYYPQDKIALLAQRKLLGKQDMELFTKGKKIKKGDWNCSYCPFKAICYESNGSARELTKLDVSDIERISTTIGDADEDESSE
jgi:hypothetical protein